jgi:hypothetical protein
MNLKSMFAARTLKMTSTTIPLRNGATLFEEGIERDIGKVNQALLPLLGIAVCAALFKGWEEDAIGAVLLWSIASLSVGATLGFLFGIPKSGSGVASPVTKADGNRVDPAGSAGPDHAFSSGRANTNLEEVSDWLTKIVVGLTLVHWATIRADVIAISANMAATFRNKPTGADQSFAAALIVGFFTLGFLFGYLYTRMFLQGAFARSDPSMLRRFNQVVEEEMIGNLGDAKIDADGLAPALPSSEQMKSAERVRKVVPTDNPQAVLSPLRELAAEYERIRASTSASSARTRAMSQIVRRMTTLALAAAPYVGEFANSSSSGERLVAVAILKVRFDHRYTEFLARRLVDDPPFIGYQAAGALLGGVRLLGGDEKARLQALVRAALDELRSKHLVDENRDELMDEILKA